MSSYRHKDGLIRGPRRGISSRNTKEDWAYYYKKQREEAQTWADEQIKLAEQRDKQKKEEALLKQQQEPQKFPLHLLEPTLPEHFTRSETNCNIYYHKQKKVLFFDCCYGKFYPKIGCPIILSFENESGGQNILYCCELMGYNEKQVEFRNIFLNEKVIYTLKYDKPFLGIFESNKGLAGWGKIPFHLFE